MREYKIRRQLFNILSKNNPNNIKEYDISIPEYKKIKKIIEEIKEKEDFRQRDDLFSSDEKWYLICNEGGGKIDISLSYDKIKSIPCNVIFNNCNIDLCVIKPKDLEKDNTETIKNHLYFYNCTFENLLIKLKNIIFEKTLTFNQCAFYNDLDIHQNQFLDHLVFINCYDKRNDKKITSLDLQENEFEGYLFIKNCAIEKINLWKNKFKNRCYFVDSNFGYKDKDNTTKLNFSNTHFKDNVYFNNSEFYSYADFHECEFDDIACFYGVKFHKIPNFSACYFKEQKAANLINVDIDKLDFKSVEKYIEDNYQDETCENKQEITEEQRNNNCKLKCAKHLKDSFRVIKDVLITQNNTLEAQEWHKLELYAKERELLFEVESCYKEKNKPFIAAKSEDKNSINLTFSVLLLWIYRVTSLHHTNLPRIINFTSLNIVAFGCLVCLITYLSYHIDKQSNFWLFGVLILFALIIGIVSLLLKKQKLKNITLILCLFLAFLLALFLMQRIAFLSSFGDIIFALLFYCLLVIVLIYLYPYINLKSFISYCFNWLVYFFLVMIVVIKPQLINPFAGIFSSDKLYESQFEKSLNDLNVSAIMILTDISQDNFNLPSKDQNISFTELNSAKALIIANKENLLKLNDVNSNITKEVLGEKYTELLKIINQDKITENTIKSTSVLYSIILLLCIFSLQKTARKNSIVPS
ncbi:pentapeptide repeat-containing protein [Campylobacter coli]